MGLDGGLGVQGNWGVVAEVVLGISTGEVIAGLDMG